MSKLNCKVKIDRAVDEETAKVEKLLSEHAEEFKRSFDQKPKPRIFELIKCWGLKK